MLGVDMIVPDISYLEMRQADILGIFISHAHDKHIGAIPMILSNMDIPVYGTNYAIAILKDTLKERQMDPEKFRLHIVDLSGSLTFRRFSNRLFQHQPFYPRILRHRCHDQRRRDRLRYGLYV
ncbi:MAG: hypothetical protein MZU97_24850 [Bacillus subtilis]|nr:hypothetical protein [Bacillus subtilis]